MIATCCRFKQFPGSTTESTVSSFGRIAHYKYVNKLLRLMKQQVSQATNYQLIKQATNYSIASEALQVSTCYFYTSSSVSVEWKVQKDHRISKTIHSTKLTSGFVHSLSQFLDKNSLTFHLSANLRRREESRWWLWLLCNKYFHETLIFPRILPLILQTTLPN